MISGAIEAIRLMSTDNAFTVMMGNRNTPRPTMPEKLRLPLAKQEGQRKRTSLTNQHLAASTTAALESMYRSVREKGHALPLVDSPSPCWIRTAANTPEDANQVWWVTLELFDKSQFPGQPFSIKERKVGTSTHALACELQSRTHPRIIAYHES